MKRGLYDVMGQSFMTSLTIKTSEEYFSVLYYRIPVSCSFYKKQNKTSVIFNKPIFDYYNALNNLFDISFFNMFEYLQKMRIDDYISDIDDAYGTMSRWMDGEFGSLVTEELAEALEGYFVSFKGLNKVGSGLL